MSSIGKLRKNAENYKINEFYRNMTPEQYRQGIEYAVKKREEELYSRFNKDVKKIQDDATTEINMRNYFVKQIIFVELLYELADELECFVKEPEFLDQKIEKIKGIYENTILAIDEYTKCKKKGQALKEFEKKKNKIIEMLDIKF